MTESPRGDRAQRRLRRAGRRRGRRGDGRARRSPTRCVEKFGGDSIAELEPRAGARLGERASATRRSSAADDPPILRYGERPLHARPPTGHALRRRAAAADRRHDRDDVRRAGHRAGGAAGRRPAARLRRRSVGRAAIASELIVMVNPEFVERDGTQLEEEGCLSVPGFNATVVRPARAVVQRARSGRQRADDRGDRAAGARVPARDGSPRRRAVRRSAARHQARRDRPQDPEAEARRQMVTARAAADRLLRHAGVRGADAASADRLAPRRSRPSCRSRIGRRGADSS